jgi:hypothetical protein
MHRVPSMMLEDRDGKLKLMMVFILDTVLTLLLIFWTPLCRYPKQCEKYS